MDDNLREYIQNISDKYLYAMIESIFARVFPDDNIVHVMLPLLRKHGMPVKNIVPFISELGEKSSDLNEQDKLQQEFTDLLTRSGFTSVKIDKYQEGDDVSDGNGRNGT